MHPVQVEEEAVWFRDAMSQVCNAGMYVCILAKPVPPKCQVYWWSQEITGLRINYIEARPLIYDILEVMIRRDVLIGR